MLIWAINSYAYATALLDIVIMILFVFVAPCLTGKGFRLKGFLTTVIFLAIEVAAMNGVALAAFPIAEQLGYSQDYLIDRTTSFGNAIMVLICCPVILIPTWLASCALRRIFTGRRFSVWGLCFLPIPISQGIILNLVNRMCPYTSNVMGMDPAFAVAFLASVAADIGFFYGFRRIQRAKQLRNQIRHDLTNQLQVAYALLE